MIIADTNVVSEMMRPEPNRPVMEWLAFNDAQLILSAVTIAEISFGIERIRPAERAPRLAKALNTIRQRYAGRIVIFDEDAAMIYGTIMGDAARRGLILDMPDGIIAAIAIRHRVALATRNVADFEFLDLQVINPWSAVN